MRAQVPDGDLGAIIEAAVTEKLERLEARRFASSRHPRKDLSKTDTSPVSRHIPAPVRRAVRERDEGRCRYVDAVGRRCEQRDRLEYHHRHPFGMGGDHRPQNIRLMCRAHNRYLAEHDYGREAMARFSGPGKRVDAAAAVASCGTTAGPLRPTSPGS
jgi:5-methylcytosine-specific restriction endonuclease McrA